MTAGGTSNIIYMAGTCPAATEVASPALFQLLGVSKIIKRQPIRGLPARSAVHLGARPAVWSITSFLLAPRG